MNRLHIGGWVLPSLLATVLALGTMQASGDVSPCVSIQPTIDAHKPIYINGNGTLPSWWPASIPAVAITTDVYYTCVAQEVLAREELRSMPDEWIQAYGLPPSTDAVADSQRLVGTTTSTGQGAVVDSIVADAIPPLPFVDVQKGVWDLTLLPDNNPTQRPDDVCNYQASNKAVEVLSKTFGVNFNFGCAWNVWTSSGGHGKDIFDAAVQLADASGFTGTHHVALAWVKCFYRNGLAAGHFALAGENADDVNDCRDPYAAKNPPDWPASQIAQHELSHTWGANGDHVWETSIMNYWGAYRGDTYYFVDDCTTVYRTLWDNPNLACTDADAQ